MNITADTILEYAFTQVIDAWSRRTGEDNAERAQEILNRMIRNYQLTNNQSLRPDVISFSSAMKAWVGHRIGGRKALEMLEEMKKQCREGNTKATPDSMTIAIAIDACAKSGLLDDAAYLLDRVEDKKKTRVMFNTLLSAYKHQEDRGNEAEALLRKMIDLSNKGFNSCSPDATTYSLCISAVSNKC